MPYKSNTCFSKHNDNPLTTYSNEHEAKDAASYVKNRYDNDVIPYKCDTCKQWHLSPKNRNTKSTRCIKCRDGNGSYKDLYLTKDSAQRRADIILQEKNIGLNLYKCPHSNGWHLTKI